MSHLQGFARALVVMALAVGFMASAMSITSARDADGGYVQSIDIDVFAGNDDLVQQLVQILIEILNDLLNGDDLADLLPSGCAVTPGGFKCDTSSADANLFIGAHCEPSIVVDGLYLCTVDDVVYSCNVLKEVTSAGPITQLVCAAP